MRVYQALLARADNLAQVRHMRQVIEARGGRIEMSPPTATGIVMVTLWLPSQFQPGDFFPGLPFYPI